LGGGKNRGEGRCRGWKGREGCGEGGKRATGGIPKKRERIVKENKGERVRVERGKEGESWDDEKEASEEG